MTHEIGHNNPPPEVKIGQEIDDLVMEAENWLDGAAIETQEQADTLGILVSTIKIKAKEADAARKVQAKPFDDGKKAVQATWKPIIDKASKAASVAQKPLTDWLDKVEREKQKAAQEAARLAQEAIDKANKLAQEADAGNIADQYRLDAARSEAEAMAKSAKRIDNAKVNVAGTNRAASLRTYYSAEITDRRAALNWVAKFRPEELTDALLQIVNSAVKSGARNIDGVNVIETRRVV